MKTKTDKATHIGNVYNDIQAIEFDINDSFKMLMDKFYVVMRKHGICQGTWNESGTGRCVSNPEWVMSYQAFKSHIESRWMWASLMTEPPKDLLAYGKKPKSNK